MTDTALPRSRRRLPAPGEALKLSGAIWFAAALGGQAAFAVFIGWHYVVSAIRGDFATMDAGVAFGFQPDDLFGNAMFILHVLLAFMIVMGGPLQLIPALRQRYTAFHRWNGRLYIAVALVISAAGLGLIWTRGALGGAPFFFGNTLNAALIMACAAMTLRLAIARRFDAHRRWALRTFIAVSGVWFMRLGYGFWALVTGGEMPGVESGLTGPFDHTLAIAHTTLPLVVLELYFLAQARGSPALRYAMAGAIIVLAAMTAAASVMAAIIFWLPAFA